MSQADLREWLNSNDEWRTGDRSATRRFQAAKNFVTEIDSFPRNTFHYIHLAIPHRPYGYLPSGRQYEYAMREDKFNVHDMTVGEISQGRAAHILQVGLADRILGKFRKRLVELGYWDDAMVIVVADHGQAYQPERNNRIVTPENFGSVAFVPLLIKYPGQKVGEIDNSNVQTIDIAPTVIDVLGINDATQVDGRSLLDDSAEVPKEKMIMSESGKSYEFSAETYGLARANALAEAAAFFALYDKRSTLFNYGAGLDYIGKTLDSLDEYKIQAQLKVHNLEKYQSVDMQAEFLPAFVQGQVVKHPTLNPNDVVVAIAINGLVRAVTTPHFSPDGQLLFNKILPEDALESNNELEAVLLEPDKIHVNSVQR